MSALPHIPNKKYFAIGEASRLCDVKPHVLRYWEQEFEELRNINRRSNRRYYEQTHIILIRRIRGLLYDRGYTIEGAKKLLAAEPKKTVSNHSASVSVTQLRPIISELETILRDLREMA